MNGAAPFDGEEKHDYGGAEEGEAEEVEIEQFDREGPISVGAVFERRDADAEEEKGRHCSEREIDIKA